jgi:hypothetical protein
MSRTTLFRVSLVLTLAAVLSLSPELSWARGGPASRPHATRTQVQSAGLLAQAWNHLVSIWGKAGSAIDPNGYVAATTNITVSATPTERTTD